MTDDAARRPSLDRPSLRRPPLDQHRLRAVRGWRVEVLEAAPSTNAVVAARGRGGEAPGLVVVAEHQTAGRGRLDRQWVTPPRAALTFSALVRPDVPLERWPWLPLLTGVAVVEGVAAAGGPACGLKWPNDVLHEGRKVAGLLAEVVDGPGGPVAVLGVGINVSTTREELPSEGATSLALLGAPVDRTALLTAVLGRLATRLAAWSGEGRGGSPGGADPARALLDDYERHCVTVGQRVRVHLPLGEVLEGTAERVTADGALVVTGPAGPRPVSVGDVVHVRPAVPDVR